MYIEEQELHDWTIEPNMDNSIRKLKSIEAYWLDRWYDKMKDITFPTTIYKTINDVPDILPYSKCMVRYENKSPKDSPYWGPCNTKNEMENIFYTSLRCKTNPGSSYCVREWVELGEEYRCFWNGQLVAVSAETDTEPPIRQILEYVKKIEKYICFHKCVFDISHLKESNELIFVEYNSWESNSGAHRFNWLDDTESFYLADLITFRWIKGEKKVPFLNSLPVAPYNKLESFDNYTIIKPTSPGNYLVTDKYVYVTNDIWLGRFTLDMKPLNWTRGVFRFTHIYLCEDGCIYAEPNFYYNDLTPKRTKSKVILYGSDNVDNVNSIKNNIKYGFLATDKNNKIVRIRLLETCELAID